MNPDYGGSYGAKLTEAASEMEAARDWEEDTLESTAQ